MKFISSGSLGVMGVGIPYAIGAKLAEPFKDVIVVDNDVSAQEAYDKIIAEKGGKAKNVKGADGFIIGDSIVINKEAAGKSGQINVGGHEILHGILTKHLKSLDTNSIYMSAASLFHGALICGFCAPQ